MSPHHRKGAFTARQALIDLPGLSQRIAQCGNDRQPCFPTDVERIRSLQDLRDVARREYCSIHAYVLRTNLLHLLVKPDTPG